MDNIRSSETILNEMKKGLLSWIPFCSGKRVLVIEAESYRVEAYADVLKEKGLIVDTVDIMSSFEGKTYDYVICIELIEKCSDAEDVLKKLKMSLKQNGILILGMNNRLGVRFLCGDKDIYTGARFDGVCNYIRSNPENGRCYSDRQIKKMLSGIGFNNYSFFSVMPSLSRPTMILSENAVPHESIGNRIFPEYDFPDGIFINEQETYDDLVEEGLFHKLANAYLIMAGEDECVNEVTSVTLAIDRIPSDAMITSIYNGIVEKRAIYPEGRAQLEKLDDNLSSLRDRGINVVKGEIIGDGYRMPYVDAPTGQQYLEMLIKSDQDKFLYYMDKFYDMIIRSSDKVGHDNNLGDIYDTVYLDMVPLNSFFVNDEFILFDQEFSERNYPINVAVVRMIDSFYHGKPSLNRYYPGGLLHERYGLKECYSDLNRMQISFLNKHIENNVLNDYRGVKRATPSEMSRSWIAMNEIGDYFCEQRRFLEMIAMKKELIIFGTGKYAEDYMSKYSYLSAPLAVIDNDHNKWGTKWHGLTVQSPDILDDYRNPRYTVLICIGKSREIIKQLSDMWYINYIVYSRGYARLDIPDGRREGKYHIGYCAGAFDMFHIGHLNLLRRAKERCDYLIVGVMSDEKMYELKKKYPVIPCNERMQVVAGCRYVDRVEELPIGRAGIMDAYEMFHFDCMFSGDDHAEDPGWLAERERLRQHGSDIVFVSYTKEQSSSAIREKMKE